MDNITYIVNKGIYINLTNRCTNRCSFCIRQEGDGVYGSQSLWLEHEPTSQEIIEDLKKYNLDDYEEVVFCGYGEPMIRLNELCDASAYIKGISKITTRINTNGQANLIHKKDVTPLLNGITDIISISMNSATPQGYYDVCKPAFGIDTYNEVLKFGLAASKHVPTVIFSVVRGTLPEEDIEACERLAKQYGGILRVREFD